MDNMEELRRDVTILHEPRPFRGKLGIYIAEARYIPFEHKYFWKDVKDLCGTEENGTFKLWQEIDADFPDEQINLQLLGEHPEVWSRTLASLSAHGYYLDGPHEFGPKENCLEIGKQGDICNPKINSSWLRIEEHKCLDKCVYAHVSKNNEIKAAPSKQVMIALIGNTGIYTVSTTCY